ncbi:MAG: GNAT family N-acetyltransferase [Nitrospirae bacterium]|nr:MAG: GNAT family N-acetyltransferase [Nitrospirota bacterium]
MIMKIRDYVAADWESVCRVHDAARPDELAGSCDPRAFVPLAKDPESEELLRSRIFVAEEDGEVIGFAAVDDSYLSFLYVHPVHYRKGVGRALLQKSIEAATDNAELWTIVLSENVAAIALYRSEGFEEVARFDSKNEGYPVTCIRMARKSTCEPCGKSDASG